MLSPAALRLVDANANRAREGVRTIEDVARFILANHLLAAAAKKARHGLHATLRQAGLDAVTLARHRNTATDVAAAPTTQARSAPRHETVAAMVVAAGHRAAEALRVLAETTRLDDAAATASPAFEALRYGVYDLQRDVLAALEAREAERPAQTGAEVKPTHAASVGRRAKHPCPQFALCVLITESLCRRPWLEVAKAAIAGGADCLQLREKELPDRELLSRAEALVEVCDGNGVACFINDRVDIALLAGADGVHLGQDDVSLTQARELAGENLWLGVSTHNLAEATEAIEHGADVCGVGAMFATQTKLRDTSGPAYLRQYLELAAAMAAIEAVRAADGGRPAHPVPHLAIGGITPENIGQLAATGCKGVAVSSVVCYAADPAEVCRQLKAQSAIAGFVV